MVVTIKDLYGRYLKAGQLSKKVTIKGWVKSVRSNDKICFLDINDGSTFKTLQVIYKDNKSALWKSITSATTGTAISITGEVVFTKKEKQPIELKLESCEYLNLPHRHYPIQKKAHSHEFLRENSHLRARTNTFYAIFKVRNQVSWAIHQFFQKNDFMYLNSPIITANDAEGAGESFTVTTLTHDKYNEDFFGKKASLTVSGQLNAEAYAQTFKKVYTFGPTFRAENSNTSRHAAEFWMVEPEVAFASLQDNIELATQLLIYVIKDVLKNCSDELAFFDEKLKEETKEPTESLVTKLTTISQQEKFKVITYTKAIELLQAAKDQGHKFEFNEITWGMDLQSEHERYICEELIKAPVFVTNYPQHIKAFYMKLNPIDPNYPQYKTVAAMDLLVPGIGELIGGSARENNYEQLELNKKQFKINDDLKWYFDLRKSGYAPSAGFGLGLERLIMFLTGTTNIRDVIPFPRTPKNLEF